MLRYFFKFFTERLILYVAVVALCAQRHFWW